MGFKIPRLSNRADELAAIRREWLDVHACTLPADRDEAEFGVALAYEAAGLTPPRSVIWVPDPALGGVVAAVLASRGTRIPGQVWTQARQHARRAAGEFFTNRAFEQAQAATRFATGGGGDGGGSAARVETAARSAALGLIFTTRTAKTPTVREPSVFASEWRMSQLQVDAAMSVWGRHAFWSHGRVDYRKRGVRLAMEAVGAPAKDLPQWLHYRTPQYLQVKECLDWAVGQHAHFEELALLDALGRLGDRGVFRIVDGVASVARAAGWWWPFEDVAVVCDRPALRSLDRQGRLHAEDGPALAYRDGFAAYFWHGRLVPRWAVLEPSVARIAVEENIEVRRCAIEAMGWARFAEEAELTLLDECPDPGNPGQWLSLHAVPGRVWGTPAHVLVCTNGSVDLDGGRHTFGLLVPITIGSALGAAAWGYGLTADEYAQLERRA